MAQPVNWWSRSRKQLWLVAGYGMLMALFIGLGWLSVYHLRAVAAADRLKTNSCHVLMRLGELDVDLVAAVIGERGFLITQNAQYLEPYLAALRAIDLHRVELRTLVADNPRQQARLTAMEPLIESLLADFQRTIELRRTGVFSAATNEILMQRDKQLMDQFDQQLAAARAEEHALLIQRTAATERCRAKMMWLIVLGTCGGVILLGILMVAVGREAAEMAIVHRSYLSRYGMAVALTALTILTLWGLKPIYGSRNLPLMIVSIASAGAAWWGGLGPGLLATGLTTALTWWLFISARYALAVPDLAEGLRLLLNLFSGSIISALAEAMHRAVGRQNLVSEKLQETRKKLVQVNANLEQMVTQRTGELHSAVTELEHISYSIAHDMRAPLRAMHGFSALLLLDRDSTLSAAARDHLRRIATAAVRMDSLVTDALDFTKALRRELPLSPVEPALVLKDLLDTYPDFHPSLADIRIDGALPIVLANPAGLMQCFSNLLHNAVKFVAAGVRPQVRISAERRADQVRIWIADNGIGIPAEFHERMFKMFERATGNYEGTGIGLAIVQKVAQRMGGAVGVESEPGQGSRFWIELKGAGQS